MEEPLNRLSIYPIVSFPNVNPSLFIIKRPGVNKGFIKLYIGNILLIMLPLGIKQDGGRTTGTVALALMLILSLLRLR